MKEILKSIVAILAGFLAVVILSTLTDFILESLGVLPNGDLFDTNLLLLALFYRTVYTILGGHITASFAPNKRTLHALVLGLIGTLIGIMAAITITDLGPAWYSWAVALEGLPCVWVGANLYQKYVTKNS